MRIDMLSSDIYQIQDWALDPLDQSSKHKPLLSSSKRDSCPITLMHFDLSVREFS